MKRQKLQEELSHTDRKMLTDLYHECYTKGTKCDKVCGSVPGATCCMLCLNLGECYRSKKKVPQVCSFMKKKKVELLALIGRDRK